MNRRVLVLLLGVVLLAAVAVPAVGVVAYRQRYGVPEPLRGPDQDPAGPLAVADDPTRGSVVVASDEGVVAGPTIEVMVSAPADATEMQLAFDPTFAGVGWQPVAERAELRSNDVGHHSLFARFRQGPDAPPVPTIVDQVRIDPTFAAAVSSADGGPHVASWARPLSPGVVVVRIEAGRLERGAVEPYDFDNPPDGDRRSLDLRRLIGEYGVDRNGEPYGRRVAGSETLVRPYDRLIGRPLDVAAATSSPWTATAADGSRDAEVLGVVSRPQANGFGADQTRVTAMVHDVYLAVDGVAESGVEISLSAPGDLVAPIDYRFDPSTTVSPAVHVNQSGHHPADSLKVGYVSVPPTSIVDTGAGPTAGDRFRVVEEESGTVVVSGTLTARPGGDELELGDLTGAAVFEADYSSLNAPGRYRLCVDAVGCSYPIVVNEDVWTSLAVDVARAMYHQRSGVALGPPYTPISRPRPYHPDDGVVIHGTDLRLFDTLDIPIDEVFERIVDDATSEVIDEAWGGHFDAGDWDRRIQHLYYVRTVVELVEQHPERFADLDLALPESGDAVPDLLDEGLWTLDLYLRLQREDGAVRGGIEASEHPQADNASWTDDLALFAYAPDPWSSYLYAGVAAQAADVLAPYDLDRSEIYAASAEAAMAWADAQPPEPGDDGDAVDAQRSVAAAALYKLTGDAAYHDVFLDTTTLVNGVDGFLSCNSHQACDAAWIYLSIDPARTDPEIRSLLEASFVATADDVVRVTEETSFGWAVENRFAPLVWGLGVGGSPSSIGLLRAYELTGDERYRAAALRSAGVTLGANPTDTVYVTGVGRTPVASPLIIDVRNGGLPVWAGTPVYGNHQLGRFGDESWVDDVVLAPAGVAPLAAEVPYLWQYYDVSDVAMFNEFTVFQSHAEALYAFAVLGATG